jgi:uncharacterized protein YcfL
MKALRSLVFVIAAALVGCSSSAPVLLNASEEGVVVRYSQGSATSADAAAAAAKFCGQYGRKAVEGEGNEMTGDTFVTFSCQEP